MCTIVGENSGFRDIHSFFLSFTIEIYVYCIYIFLEHVLCVRHSSNPGSSNKLCDLNKVLNFSESQFLICKMEVIISNTEFEELYKTLSIVFAFLLPCPSDKK